MVKFIVLTGTQRFIAELFCATHSTTQALFIGLQKMIVRLANGFEFSCNFFFENYFLVTFPDKYRRCRLFCPLLASFFTKLKINRIEILIRHFILRTKRDLVRS